MAQNYLKIKGAKTHNLKNVSLSIPKNKLVVVTGVSGSGKSSLVFDTIYSEGQRRYVESLSSYARQFLGVMDKPEVESIEGISPAIAIDQKTVSNNPRSTVGTITEIYDYLRLLFAHAGTPYCPNCDTQISASSPGEISDIIETKEGKFAILAPLVNRRKGEHRAVLEEVSRAGFLRVRLDGTVMQITEALGTQLDPKKKHTIEVVVDRVEIKKGKTDRIRLVDSVETALKMSKGTLIVADETGPSASSGQANERFFSEKFACAQCGFAMRELEPRTFSFNSPYGACQGCSGLGTKMEVDPDLVIPNKSLSLAEGAIKPWMTASHRVGRQGWYWMQLRNMAQKYNFKFEKPVGTLPKKALNVVLYGDEDFEGVVANLERRYKETDSEWTRAEIEKYMNIKGCPECAGKRLKSEALAVKVARRSIDEVVHDNINDAVSFFANLKKSDFSPAQWKISEPILKEVRSRFEFLQKVGLGYLTLARSAGTLSGGEAQRIRLATQLGSQLSGVFYILDEPSIGLHARDQKRLIDTIKELRDMGNSVLVVEHDPLTISEADYVVDIGPGAGKHGGKLIFQGTPAQLYKSKTLTGKYVSGKLKVDGRLESSKSQITNYKKISNHKSQKNGQRQAISNKRPKTEKFLTIKGARHNNLKNIDAKIPLGKLVCVTGVSGSGKSSLVNDIVAKALVREFHGAHTIPGKHKKIEGVGNLDKAIVIDQSPIGRTPRSNPATYTGAFSPVRDLLAKTPEAKSRGYKPGRFSFNVKGGRCATCRGGGVNKVEMFFLSDVYVECDKCAGKRYNKEVLEIEYKGKNIADVLKLTITDALEFFENIPSVKNKLATLAAVGLGYMELGQPAPSLSGGEAQRVKLATELARRSTGKTLYILDEPTTGLHADDINKLLGVSKELVAAGNSVLVIEHNMDIISNADWLIDLGPEGGEGGGEVVAQGTPAQVANIKKSHTGKFLKKMIQ